jgi:S1/P1 Nuclease
MRLIPAMLSVLLLVLSEPAFAWAPLGHQVVAAIAARNLTPKAKAQVSALLGGEAGAMMVLDSSWADEIRSDRPETGGWHYVNIEIGSGGYNAARDCPNGNCVVAQINRDAAILSDPRAPRPQKVEALRFLIHFVGDIHQPLHAADRNDKGGNDEKLNWHRKHLSLHQIWDQEVVTALGQDYLQIAAASDAAVSPQQKQQISGGTPSDWANESFALAGREIYARLPPYGRIHLPDDYSYRESAVARLQLEKAGLRLAALLNRVYR